MNARRRVVLAGGSGFLGQSLARALVANGYEVIVLSRRPARGAGPIRHVQWNGKTAGGWAGLLDGAKAVVNLTGKSVNCRYTPANRREIVDSRVDSVRVLGQAVARCADAPEAFVQAGSLAIYGDAGDRWCDESAPAGSGFSADVCARWEDAFREIDMQFTRKSLLRIGFALGAEGGALQMLARLTRAFLGGTIGDGRQYISWLHIADLNRMFLRAIERRDIEGVFNATGPNPVTNAEFMRELRRALHRPWSPPVPAWAVRAGSWLMRTEPSLALTGRRCAPRRFVENGFGFEFPNLPGALANILATQ